MSYQITIALIKRVTIELNSNFSPLVNRRQIKSKTFYGRQSDIFKWCLTTEYTKPSENWKKIKIERSKLRVK